MTEVLAHGPERPPPRHTRLVVASVCVLALGGLGVVTLAGEGPFGESAAGGPATPSASGEPAAPGTPSGPGRTWPTRPGACGSQVAQPMLDTEPMLDRAGARLLAGGNELAEVDPATGAQRVLARVDHPGREQVSAVAEGGGVRYGLVVRCDNPQREGGVPMPSRLVGVSGAARPQQVPLSGPIDDLMAGDGAVWGVDYPDDPDTRVLLRAPGGRTLRLPRDTAPFGVSRAGIVAVTTGPDGPRGPAPTVLVLSVATGASIGSVGIGFPIAVAPGFVVWSRPECGAPVTRCVLVRTAVPRTGAGSGAAAGARRYPLPDGRAPTSAGVVSPDGSRVAFALARADADDDAGHPGPPSDIAVLDLGSARLAVVPGLVLPPKASAGLAFSTDGRWLFVTISQGHHGHILSWQPGRDRPLRSSVRLPGPLTPAGPPIRTLAGR